MADRAELRRTRFAPSPTGFLHLGHAYSALVAARRADPGQFLLRIEDIDLARCKPEYEAAIYEDLRWLGLTWPEPVLRQSERMQTYSEALERLIALGLCYPCNCTRGDIRAALGAPQEGALGPDGPAYPGTCRGRPMDEAAPGDAIRLDMQRALQLAAGPLTFEETGSIHAGTHQIDPEALTSEAGDIILARRDLGTSYHLAVVVDDAAREITEVVRGADLFSATFIHILLQRLLALPTPTYHHHALIRDASGKRLAKRDDARAIRAYREAGATAQEIRALVGLG